jgi:hypothetical protein
VTVAKSSRSHDDLQQLLDERKRFEQWLATLESRRASTPEHVYKRVHADYEQRLAGVRDQLTQRTGEIRTTITGLKERLKQTTEQETERVDELHEAELRAAVGELTPEQWELRKREVEVELKRFVDEKKKISDELNQLLLIMEQTTEPVEPQSPVTPPAPEESSQPSEAVSAEAAPAPTFTPAVEPPVVTPAPMPPPAAQPVAADHTRVRSKTPARARTAIPDQPPPVAPAADEKATVAIESLAPADGRPARIPDGGKETSAPESAPAQSQEKAEARSAAHGRQRKPDGFAPAPKDPKRENEKTLKCAECGAMNYPTEWYCESCGGELSAL